MVKTHIRSEMASRLGGDGVRFRDLPQFLRKLGCIECLERFRLRLEGF